MTNKETIECVECLKNNWTINFNDLEPVGDIAIGALKRIRHLPSAEPQIIRCKDCKHASPNGEYGCKAYHFKQYEVHEMYADDFCSKGERRTE